MEVNGIHIKETKEEDLEHIVALWNDGDVMKYVGFPDGLGVTIDSLEERWLPSINKDSRKIHYSIYHQDLGFCGESFYEVNDNQKAALDIKLFSKARGKGIAFIGLQHAIGKAFSEGNATVVYVDPQKGNDKAIRLYQKLGFVKYPHPDPNERALHDYYELSFEDYNK